MTRDYFLLNNMEAATFIQMTQDATPAKFDLVTQVSIDFLEAIFFCIHPYRARHGLKDLRFMGRRVEIWIRADVQSLQVSALSTILCQQCLRKQAEHLFGFIGVLRLILLRFHGFVRMGDQVADVLFLLPLFVVAEMFAIFDQLQCENSVPRFDDLLARILTWLPHFAGVFPETIVVLIGCEFVVDDFFQKLLR